jgi:hypothetical protein
MLAVVCNSELHMLTPEVGGEVFGLRKHAEAILTELVQRGRRLGTFRIEDDWLATAAIGGMGLRVAFWFTPERGVSEEKLVRNYTDFALRLLGAAAPRKTTRR